MVHEPISRGNGISAANTNILSAAALDPTSSDCNNGDAIVTQLGSANPGARQRALELILLAAPYANLHLDSHTNENTSPD